MRAFERRDLEEKDNLLLPVFEYLSIDYGRPLAEGITFHAQGWGRHDLSGNGDIDNTRDGNFLYGYLGYQFSKGGPEVRLGRQAIFTGVTSEAIDGLLLRTPFSRWMTLTAFSGAPAADGAETERRDQRIFGGRLGFTLDHADMGVSFRLARNTDSEDNKKLGVDLYAMLFSDMAISGYSSLNMVSGSWAEHAYELRIPIGNVQITPMYQRIKFKDMFDEGSRTSGPFRFLGETDEILTAVGADLTWWNGPLEIGLLAKNYNYDQKSESDLYSAAFLNWASSKNTELAFECGRMDGDNPENRFLMARWGIKMHGPFLLSIKNAVSADLMYVGYDEPIYGQKQSFSSVVSYSRRLFRDRAAMVISGAYSRDPYFDRDVDATLMIIYDGGSGAVEVNP